MIRSFIAIDLPQPVLGKITEITSYFKTKTPSKALRWVSPDNLHLTIKFLGDVPEKNIEAIKTRISMTASGYRHFSIAIRNLGMYPNPHKPRVIWLGVDCDPTLIELHDELDRSLKKTGIEPEKRAYSPHLTIARVSKRADLNTIKKIGDTLSRFKVDTLGVFDVTKIYLYKSDLTPSGPIYTQLLCAPLNAV